MYYLFDLAKTTKNYGSVTNAQQQSQAANTVMMHNTNTGRYVDELGTPYSDNHATTTFIDDSKTPRIRNTALLEDEQEQDPLLPIKHSQSSPPPPPPLVDPLFQFNNNGAHHYHYQQQERGPGVVRDDVLSMDQAIDRLGMGVFQYRILIAAGLFMAADSIQSVLLSFLSKSQQWQSFGDVDDNDGTMTSTTYYNATTSSSTRQRRYLVDYGQWTPLAQTNSQQTDSVQMAQVAEAMNDLTMVVLPAAVMGAVVWGLLGDVIGRRSAFVYGAAPLVAIFGLGTAVVSASSVLSNDWLLLTSFLVAFGVGGVTVPFDLLSELLSLQHRAKCLILLQVFWTVGACVIHIVLQYMLTATEAENDAKAMFIMVPQLHADADNEVAVNASLQWIVLVGICAIPCVFATILGIVAVPESPRWLVAKGYQDEAIAILRQAASANHHPQEGTIYFPKGVLLYSHEQPESLSSICNLCATDWMKITSALWATYFGMAFLDHGTLTLTVSVFSNDARQQDYQAIFRAAAELAGLWLAWWTIDDYGRIRSQQFAFLSGGVLCLGISMLITPVTMNDYDNLLLVLAFIARMVVTTGTCAAWISTTEVLATEIRTSRHAIAHAVRCIGDFVAQVVFWQITHLPAIGGVLMGLGVWTTLCCSALPETKAKDMGVGHLPWLNHGNPSNSRKRSKKKVRHSSK
jgi:MFS family permease